MSTSPVSPEDIRAAAEVHRELGPEYSDAVVASFIDKVEREVAARVEARLAAAAPAREPAARRGRSGLMKSIAIGACAGALVTVAGVRHFDAGLGRQGQAREQFQIPNDPIHLLPYYYVRSR
jgi:hypothetical protein